MTVREAPFTVIAPGKLVVVGEYGVLDGAGAIVAAVNRGVRCVVTAGDAVETPKGDDRFVRAALLGAPARRYTFTDDNPVDLPSKPGFGGSAAATVAACLAGGFEPERAYPVHAEVQRTAGGGGGSGVDVFASIHGGVRQFPDGHVVPHGVFVAVWSGASASTGSRVAWYQAWHARASFVHASRELVFGFYERPYDAMREAYARLREMASAAGIAYDTPAHARIAELADAAGGAAKPSGAGGGDIAVAMFPDPERADAFARACAAEDLRVIPVRVTDGARVVDEAACTS